MNQLHVDSIIQTYGSHQILTDVFISCNKGDIIGLLGRNGTGKSTLLKIIFGSLNADRKFVKIGNIINPDLYKNRNLISYLPQVSFLPNHIKVARIISLFCCKKQLKSINENRLIKPLLCKKSKELSSGEKRLLEVLIIIFSDAKFILLDEPFNGIAPIYKEEIKAIILEQKSEKGFIITDHDYNNILDISTKLLLINDGGTKEIKSREELETWGYLNKI